MFLGVLKTFLPRRKVFLLALLLIIPSQALAEGIDSHLLLRTNRKHSDVIARSSSDEAIPRKPLNSGDRHARLRRARDDKLAYNIDLEESELTQDDPAVDIGEVHVEGRLDYESLAGMGSFTTVIKPTSFDKQMKTAPEILSETVGVDVTSLGGEGQLSTVSIRGSSAEQVVVFLDGVRINSALFGIVDFATIPVNAIERIEVIRGASSARFGTDAIGGVINIVTKKAGAKRAIDLKISGGSFHTLHTAEAWREPRDDWDLVLSHTHRSTGGDFTFKNAGITLGGGQIGQSRAYTRLHNRSIAEDILAKIGIDLTEKAHLAFSNDFFWTDRQVPGTEVETTLLYPANPLEASEEIFRDTANIRFQLDEVFVPPLSFETGATYAFMHDHFTDPSPAIGNPIDVTYITHAPEAHMQWMHILSEKHLSLASTFRAQYRLDYTDNKSPRAGAILMGRHTRSTGSAFLEETLGLFGERLLVIPQARFEKASDRRRRFSWRVAVIGRPLDWLDIKGHVDSSFRYPNFGELYFPDQGYLRGNPNLSDEESLNWDAGFIVHPKNLKFEVAFFQNRIDNQILWVPISATTIQPINTFRVNAHGIEAAVTWMPIEELKFDVNYTWLDAHFAGSSRQLPGRPKHKFNFRAEGRIKFATLFGTLQYVGRFPVNTANTVWISDHTKLNLGTTFTFAKHFFATFEVKDVTNVQIYDARAFPLPRRSYWVTVGAKI